MRLFLDSGNLQEIKEAMESGVITGVTTNPSIIAKEPKTDFIEHVKAIVDIIDWYTCLPLSIEVFALEPQAMIAQARQFNDEIGYKGLNIKIPVSWENMGVIHEVAKILPVNATCIFTEEQAIAAYNAGARYVSLFYDRAKKLGLDPIRFIYNISQLLENRNCEIICGSIHGPQDIRDCICAGADIVTAGLDHIKALCPHPGTTDAVNRFNADFAAWMEVDNAK